MIRGSNFAPESQVIVAGVLIAEAQALDTQTITLEAPALPSGLATITVQNRGGLDQTSILVQAIPIEDLSPGDVTTVAAGSTFTGDGSMATMAGLDFPHGVAVDAVGNFFIADTEKRRIRKVDVSSGVSTTVAGTGAAGFSGDDGPATAATLDLPLGLAVDPSGNLYIADSQNHSIRRVDASSGIITTVAGIGVAGFSGDDGPAVDADLHYPAGVAVDAAGNLFIVDCSNHRIRRVDFATGIITTVAGTGEAGFSGDGGPATAASLASPFWSRVGCVWQLLSRR